MIISRVHNVLRYIFSLCIHFFAYFHAPCVSIAFCSMHTVSLCALAILAPVFLDLILPFRVTCFRVAFVPVSFHHIRFCIVCISFLFQYCFILRSVANCMSHIRSAAFWESYLHSVALGLACPVLSYVMFCRFAVAVCTFSRTSSLRSPSSLLLLKFSSTSCMVLGVRASITQSTETIFNIPFSWVVTVLAIFWRLWISYSLEH